MPTTHQSQTPYIWRISKDGKQREKKAPKNAFVSSDPFTIRLTNQERSVVLEDVLSKIETQFSLLMRNSVVYQRALGQNDRVDLCVFAAAMTVRVDAWHESWKGFYQDIKSKFAAMEQHHGAEPRASRQIEGMMSNLRPLVVATSLEDVANEYYNMSMAIFLAPPNEFFITSDRPVVWFDPEAYKRPWHLRSPGLAYPKIEVTMPLTPKCMLFLSRNEQVTGYLPLRGDLVQGLNYRTRTSCDKWFVSWRCETRNEWFERRTPPKG